MVGLVAPLCHAELHWIWISQNSGDRDIGIFTKSFTLGGEVKAATLVVSCDNGAKASLNGQPVLENPDWQSPTTADVKARLKPGENELSIRATNKGGAAALLVKLSITLNDGKTQVVESGPGWRVAREGESTPKEAAVLGKYGVGPWGRVLEGKPGGGNSGAAIPGVATAPEEITVPAGFKVELLHSVPKGEQGSWVALAPDPKGRLIVSDQSGILYRITVDTPEKGKVAIEPISVVAEGQTAPVGGAHGLLCAYESLYAMVCDGKCKHGLYRLQDTNGDDHYDKATLLKELKGGGEHGPHSITLGPDGALYFSCGNHTELPVPLEESRPARAWQEDHLLPRMWDANGHAKGRLAPGGYMVKTDPEGKTMELYCSGFRNEFGIAFNDAGDLFTYDADMEWDIGSPWYRPTRANHCVSGGEYGWRSGSGKWPGYYPDSLPTTLDIGPGSPTAVYAGSGAKFPARYQHALFMNDWTYGTMYALHLTPRGGSYQAEREEFVFGRPLPLTGVTISPQDGAMYFLIGGRGTQSGLYRVTYQGDESTAPAPAPALTPEGRIRRELEVLHQPGTGPEAIDKAWTHLNSADRHVRFAARVAIERQPSAAWASRALAETGDWASLESAVALARVGDKSLQNDLLKSLARQDWGTLDLPRRLALIRAHGLVFTRMGPPSEEARLELLGRFDDRFPSHQSDVDRELCDLLIYLDSPTVVTKAVQLLNTASDELADIASEDLLSRNSGYASAARALHASRPNRQQIGFAFSLRNAKRGWTPESRKAYFQWFPKAREFKGGNSFSKFIENIRTEALANFVPEGEKEALAALSTQALPKPTVNLDPPKGPGRNWTVDEAAALLDGGLRGRNFASGKNLFQALACSACHRFNGEWGGIGPDITGAGNRYSHRDLMENIVDPSKIISDQYETHQIRKKDGTFVIGRIIVEENGKVFVATNPFVPADTTAIDENDIADKKTYPISMMPAGLINVLSPEELKDLAAYLLSAGNPEDALFKP